ncbi:LytR family transcriptional regulator, partial [Streptomyces bryophytorum]|nr:LytR family transcriptional regulator [Actinacidiphila bryophytorum]
KGGAGAGGGARAGGAGADPRGGLLQALAGAAGAARGGRGSLAHPARLFGLLDTATSGITADPGLSSLSALYGLAGALRGLPAGGVTLVTLPTAPAGSAAQGAARGKVLRHPAADRLFAALRADRPVAGDPEP